MTVRAYAVSLHDVAPATWPRCERLLELIAPYGVPVTLLVTPHYHGGVRADQDPGFGEALRARVRGGDEVALHGFLHSDDGPPPRGLIEWLRRRVYTASEGEFDAISAACARQRYAAGCECLAALGLSPRGFVAPAWLLGNAARAALATAGFEWTCTRDELIGLPSGPREWAPSLVYSTRSRWRRVLSRYWNARRLHKLAHAPLVRVALHPADADHPAVLAEWRVLLDRLATRVPMLEFDWLRASASAAAAPPPDALWLVRPEAKESPGRPVPGEETVRY